MLSYIPITIITFHLNLFELSSFSFEFNDILTYR